MSYLRCIAIGVVMAFLSVGSASAVVIGDKDWRQVTDTVNISYNSIATIFNQITGQCDTPSCILSGVDLTGHTWASNEEVNGMLASVTGLSFANFLNDGTLYGTDINNTDPIFTLFTPTATGTPPDLVSMAILGEYVGGFTRTGFGNTGTTIEITNFLDADLADRVAYEQHFDTSRTDAPIGGWFYTDVAVPEPTTLLLMSIGIAGLGFVRKYKVF